MDQHKSRWAVIVFWSEESLAELHDLERRYSRQGRYWQQAYSHLLDAMVARHKLRPYWAAKVPAEEQETRLKLFQRTIYPIWAPIAAAWEKTWATPNAEDELAVLQRIDRAIWESGHRPERDSAADMSEIRKKAAMSDKYRRAAA